MIEITKPVMGKDANYKLEDIIDYNAYFFKNREKMPIVAKVWVNGEEKEKSYQLCDGDDVVVKKNNEEEPKVIRPKAVMEDYSLEDALFDNLDDEPKRTDSLFSQLEEEYDNFDDESLINETEQINSRTEVIKEEDTKFLNLLINKKALKINPNKENYYLEDLLQLLNYNMAQFGEKFAININGIDIENNCKICDGDDIMFRFH